MYSIPHACLFMELVTLIFICIELQDCLCSHNEHCGRCNMKYVLLEMDRILRPNGYAIIYESSYFSDAILNIAKRMRWSCQKNKTEDDSENEMILICQKEFSIPTSHIRWNKTVKVGTSRGSWSEIASIFVISNSL